MGYNKANYLRIRDEYSRKYLTAQSEADARKLELQMKIPGLWDLDREIASAGSEIMGAVFSSATREEKDAKMKAAQERNRMLLEKRMHLLMENGYPANYTDVSYECSACGDTGFIGTKMCACMRRALILAGYESSGIANLLRTQSFETFSLDYYKQNPQVFRLMQYNFESLRGFAESFATHRGENFLLIGGTGRGKTHLSSAVAGRVIENGYDAYYISAVNLFRIFDDLQFRRNRSDEEEAALRNERARCFEADLLILDDLGTELTNQFTVSVLYDVIDTRINSKKSTLISTNLNHEELRKRYWDRVTSRLFGEYKPLVFEGFDVREWKIRNAMR